MDMDMRGAIHYLIGTDNDPALREMLPKLDENTYLDGKFIAQTCIYYEFWTLFHTVLLESAVSSLEDVYEVFDDPNNCNKCLYLCINAFCGGVTNLLFIKCFKSYEIIFANNSAILARAFGIYSFCHAKKRCRLNCEIFIKFGLLERGGPDKEDIPEVFVKYWDKCKMEVEKMKTFFMPVRQMPLYDFVKLKCANKRCYHIGDVPLKEILTQVQNNFDIYSDLACYKIRQAAKRRKWLNMFQLVLQDSNFKVFPREINYKIFTELKDSEMRNFVNDCISNVGRRRC